MFGHGLTGLGIAWIATTGLGCIAISRGVIHQHREWMIRSYVVTFAFVMFRVLAILLEVADAGTKLEQLPALSWICWSVPLLITECVLQGRKILAATASA